MYILLFFTGEFSRVYKKKDLAKILSTAALLGITVMSLAPCSPIMFYGIHFKIGAWSITQNNFIGIFLAILSSILLIISYFHLHNLTQDKNFDLLKDQILGNDKVKDNDNTKKSTIPKLWSTKDVVTNWNLMFLLTTEAFLSFSYYQMDLVITMIAVKTYNWSIFYYGILTGIVTFCTSILLYNVQRRLLGNGLNIYFLYSLGFVLIALLESLLLMTSELNLKSFYSQMVALFLIITCNMVQGVGSTVYCRWLMFALTPSHSASIIESHRFMFCRVLASIGYFTSSYVFEMLWLLIPIYVCLCFLIVALYAVKKNDYIKL